MEYYSEQEDVYAGEIQWSNNDETDQEYNGEYIEYVYENQQWYGEEGYDAYVDVEEEKLEPKPPDPDLDPYYDPNEFREEYSNSGYEDSIEDYYGEHKEEGTYGSSYPLCMKTKNIPKKKSHHYGTSAQQTTSIATRAKATKRNKKGSESSFNPFVFTGYYHDPEEYLQWEAEMEYWFRLHKIPKEEKLSCAISMLEGEAYEWWLKEDAATYYTSRAVHNWGTLKARMYREFTREYQVAPTKVEAPKPRAKSNVREAKAFSKPTHNSWTKEVSPISKEEKPRPSSNTSQVTKNCQQILEMLGKMELAKISDELDKTDCEVSVSSIMHLSCVEKVEKSVGKQGESRGPDEPESDKRSSKVDTHESESTQVKEVDKSEQTKDEPIKEVVVSPEIGELVETSNDQHPLEEPAMSQEDNSLHNENLVTKVCELKQVNHLCTNLVGCSLENRLQVDELPHHKPKGLNHEVENDITKQVQIPLISCNKMDRLVCDVIPKETCQLVQTDQEIRDLRIQNPEEQGHVLERNFVITMIKKEHERNYGNILAAKENVPQVSFTKPDQLRVISNSQKLFGAMPSKFIKEDDYEDRSVSPSRKSQGEPPKVATRMRELSCATPPKPEVNAVRNSLSLDILHQLLAYVKGLIKIKKTERVFGRASRVESILVLPRVHEVDSIFKFVLVHIYTLKSTITHLFLCQEVECLAGLIQGSIGPRNVKEKPPDQRTTKKQEVIIDLLIAKVRIKLLKSDFNLSMTTIMHLFLSMSVEKGTGLNKRYIGQRNMKEEPPDQYPRKPQVFTSVPTSARVWNTFLKSDLKYSMTVIMRLLLSLSVEQGIGMIKRHMGQKDVKEEPPDQRGYEYARKPELRKQAQDPKHTQDDDNIRGFDKGLFQLKEKPPDYPTSVSFQGKLLNPNTLQWTNLTYLCVGETVLRTKPLEEGGNDEVIDPSTQPAQEDPPIREVANGPLTRAKTKRLAKGYNLAMETLLNSTDERRALTCHETQDKLAEAVKNLKLKDVDKLEDKDQEELEEEGANKEDELEAQGTTQISNFTKVHQTDPNQVIFNLLHICAGKEASPSG